MYLYIIQFVFLIQIVSEKYLYQYYKLTIPLSGLYTSIHSTIPYVLYYCLLIDIFSSINESAL
jgi:hypothetical protein